MNHSTPAGELPDQSYYWTPEWQEGERIAAEELAQGLGRTYDNPADAIRWLTEPDPDEQAATA